MYLLLVPDSVYGMKYRMEVDGAGTGQPFVSLLGCPLTKGREGATVVL